MDLAQVAAELDPVLILAALTALAVLNFILLLFFWGRQRRLLKRYRTLLQGSSGRDLEGLLLDQSSMIQSSQAAIHDLDKRLTALAADATNHLQKLGVVRFNPFPESGSDLSFSVALLDSKDNGVVITSLYGRSESRTYAKPILAGHSSYVLTEEEKEALAKANKGKTA